MSPVEKRTMVRMSDIILALNEDVRFVVTTLDIVTDSSAASSAARLSRAAAAEATGALKQ